MIVLDASAAVQLILRKPGVGGLEARLFAMAEPLHAPHLIDLEVAQVLRRHVHNGEATAAQGHAALDAWLAMPVGRHGHDLLMPRVWALRNSMTAYDAIYIALAEALGATLITLDAKLAGAHGHKVSVETFRG